jgi:hypothetical protein
MTADTINTTKRINKPAETAALLLDIFWFSLIFFIVFDGYNRVERTGFHTFHTSRTIAGTRHPGMSPWKNDFAEDFRRTCVNTFPTRFAFRRYQSNIRCAPGAFC